MKKKRKQPGRWNLFEQAINALLVSSGVKFKYESERIPYVLSGHYIPDFVIDTPLGLVYIEAKGYLRPEHKRKMVAVKRQHPEIDLRIVFYSKRLKDIKWAEKIGMRWAIGTIPEEWLHGL